MNIELFNWFHAGAGSQPMLDFLAVIMAEATPYVVIISMAIFWVSRGTRGRRTILEAAAAVTLGLLLNQIIALLYFHPRPFMIGLGAPLIPHPPETSFPSDHATLLFAAALALLFRREWKRQGAFFLLLALAGSWGRVYAGIHFPFDIIGSLLVALLSVAIMASLRGKMIFLYDWTIRLTKRLERDLRVKKHTCQGR